MLLISVFMSSHTFCMISYKNTKSLTCKQIYLVFKIHYNMIWIIGIVLFLLEIYILKHTVKYNYDYNSNYKLVRSELKPLTIRIWHVLILLIGNIYYVCLLTLLIFLVYYIRMSLEKCKHYSEETWKINIKWINKLKQLLNKIVW